MSNEKKLSFSSEEIKQEALKIGFHRVGIASITANLAKQAENKQRLQTWLNKGYQAEMTWMSNSKRQNIQECGEDFKSVISVALNYYTPIQRSDETNIAKISRYGWGRDYHRIITKKLKLLSNWLTKKNDQIKVRYYVDTGPIQDKFWAEEAGIGWVAKNGNVITKDYGSWVFLGEILTNLELTTDKPHTNHCGTCTRCLDACPTQAITEPFVVNANLCIAYHTIENREPNLPEEIASKLNGWVAGCDICQDVCPWNQRFAKVTDIPDFFPYEANVNPKLTELAQMTETEWDKRFQGSALRRIKPEMWRRNAQLQIEKY
ncbi:MAG: tRNA epoxyqueuosine(34) reductase QueG [Cyanobacteria bacterium]|nr:tRNA epoxyqueuosine(34) reductase QueG [Cyanobacteria bacterium CG_2015-16_32_12]NCO78600.1 tRNA epoxyqueuosine(34) reductase QueG [Cyanobacteria bacterium CG_2015-22_32_23]NCQ02992.1 tRNA epoxyqueuosine(34) reductase QueG [Cyanobacteria bacterium CG_2015-09_32_10]NCS83683.1 tRNA epoxyqueuosine(34) reductase QueG [Cyanobacteria bacterium CG_2015-02_32_10]